MQSALVLPGTSVPSEPSQLRLALRRRPVLRMSCVRSLCQCVHEGVEHVQLGESLAAILEGCCAHNASQHCSSLLRGCSGTLPKLCAALRRAPLPRLSQLALLHALLLGVETVDSDACRRGEGTLLVLALLDESLDSQLAGEAEAQLVQVSDISKRGAQDVILPLISQCIKTAYLTTVKLRVEREGEPTNWAQQQLIPAQPLGNIQATTTTTTTTTT